MSPVWHGPEIVTWQACNVALPDLVNCHEPAVSWLGKLSIDPIVGYRVHLQGRSLLLDRLRRHQDSRETGKLSSDESLKIPLQRCGCSSMDTRCSCSKRKARTHSERLSGSLGREEILFAALNGVYFMVNPESAGKAGRGSR
jgi:hypothetical protein